MNSFEYCSPTEMIFGKGVQLQAAAKLKEAGATKVLILYGGGSVKRNGLLDQVCDSFTANNLSYIVLGGVKPNPLVSFVRTAIEKGCAEKVDFVLAVGGGSVIDTAKAAAHGIANPEYDIWDDIWQKKMALKKTLPVASILTLAAAGSETSDSAVLTEDKTELKRGLNTVLNRPKFAFMNPELTYSAPKYQVACGIADILMHTLERYFAEEKDNYMTDFIAEGLLKNVINFSKKALAEENDYTARSEIMYCGSLSHCGLTGLGRQRDFSVHKLGHEISGKYDVAHGASLTTMWPSWARYSYKTDAGRFAHLADVLWNIKDGTNEERALQGITKLEEYFKSIGMPTSFSELSIGIQSDKAIEYLADMCTDNGSKKVGFFQPISKADAIAMYKMANH